MPASNGPGRGPAAAARGWLAAVGLAGAAALLFAVSFPWANGAGAWPLCFMAILPLALAALRARTTVQAVVSVLVTQMALWLWMERWMDDVTRPGYLLLSLYLALYPALFAWLLRRVARHPLLGSLPLALTIPVLWTGVEFLRAAVAFHGYPWYLLGHPAIGWTGLVQSADLLGAYFVSSLVALPAGMALDLLRHFASPPRPGTVRASVAVTASRTLLNIAYGTWRLRDDERALRPGPTVLAIQTNLPQDNKSGWPLEEQRLDVAAFLAQTRDALAGSGPVDLIAWPETMIPGAGLDPPTVHVLEGLGERGEPWLWAGDEVVALQRSLGVPILAGSPAWIDPEVVDDADGTRHWVWRLQYNSAFLIQGGPPYPRYDKVVLTPFGETMPYISAWPWLEGLLLDLGARGMSFDLDAAPTVTRLVLRRRDGTEVTLVTPICFEDTVAHLCRRMVYSGGGGGKVADLIVNLSNDGWFGDHDAGRAQHLQAARFRCIENRVPMIRVVNTGLSASIDSLGRVVASTAPRQATTLLSAPALDSRHTLYGRVGDLWGWLCLAAAALSAAWTFVRTARSGSTLILAMAALPAILSGCVKSSSAEPWPKTARTGEGTWSAPPSAPPPAPPSTTPTTAQPAALRASAIALLRQAAGDPEAVVRANAIQAMAHAPSELEALLVSGLGDPNRGVRFVAAMAAGTHRVCQISDLLEPLLLDNSDSVRAAAIFALRRCGRAIDPGPLSRMIVSEDPEVRANAALVLAELGNASAVPMIRNALGVRMGRVTQARAAIVELQLAEAMVRLGDDTELEAIRAKLWVPVEQAELTAVAIEICGRLGDKTVVPNLVRFAEEAGQGGRPRQPAEVKMAATWALARLEPSLASAAVPLAFVDSTEFQLRMQAALTLGELGSPATLGALAPLLEDERAQVRVAAAGAILQVLK